MATLKNKASVQFTISGTTKTILSNETELTILVDLTALKTQTPLIAFPGDTVSFTVVVTNPNPLTSATAVTFADDLITNGYAYKAGTLKINGTANAGNPQTGVSLGTIAGLGVVTVAFDAIVQ